MKATKSKTGICKTCAAKQSNSQINVSQCSCDKCDSLDCFILRNKEQCSCIPECVGSSCTLKTKDQQTNENDENISPRPVQEIQVSESIIKESENNDVSHEVNINNKASSIKKHSRYSYSGVDPRSKADDVPADRLHARSATVMFSRKDIESNTAELSAQIMNVPYKDFKESISYHKPEVLPTKSTKLSKLDIFKRIKEAYKACSCKVCECIAGRSLPARSNYCTCKPCECKDCATLLKKLENRANSKQHFIGCPCIRCVRDQCRGVVKKPNAPLDYCDCDPCDCINCSETFSKPCNCLPCDCIECKSYAVPKKMRMVVSTMREDIPARSYCQCSPCACGECGQDYPMSSSLRHEMATGISRPANCRCETCASQSCEASDGDTCTCEVQKRLMRKPVEKDVRDYDIHRASVTNVSLTEKRYNNDTIAMFAAFGSNYLGFGPSTKNICSCADCECIICSCKDKTTPFVKQSQGLPLQELDHGNNRACKCSPCECEICDKMENVRRGSDQCLPKYICKCDVCDCLNCNDVSIPSTSNAQTYKTPTKLRKVFIKNACQCRPCECSDCQKLMYKCTGDRCDCAKCKCEMCSDQNKFINDTDYHSRTGLFPSLGIKFNEKDLEHDIRQFENFNQITTKPVNIRSRNDISFKPAFLNFEGLDDSPVKEVNITNNSRSSQYVSQIKEQPILTCEAYVQCMDKNIIMQYSNSKTAECKSSVCSMTENFSCETKKFDHMEECIGMPQTLKQTFITNDTNSTHTNEPAKFADISISQCLNDFSTLNFNVDNGSMNDTQFGKEDKVINKCVSENNNNNNTSSPDKLEYESYLHSDEKNTEKMYRINTSGSELDGLSKVNNENELTCVHDLSLNLVTSLRNANKRLSNLMHPRIPQNFSNIGPSKASISLPFKKAAEIKSFTKNVKNSGDISDMEIDYDMVNSSLKQAKVFSDELAKVLNDYKKANERLQNKSHVQRPYESNTIMAEKTKLRERFLANTNKMSLISNCDSMKKYGSHNLNIEKIKQSSDIDHNNEIAKLEYNLRSNVEIRNYQLVHPEEDSRRHEVSVDNKTNTNEDYDYRNHSNESILNNIASTTKEKPSDDKMNGTTQPIKKSQTSISENKRKLRPDRRNNKGSSRLRVPRSVVLYKRLKLKEALINLATNANMPNTNRQSQQDTSISQSITSDKQTVVSIEPTMAQHNIVLEERCETATSTSGCRDDSYKHDLQKQLHLENAADEDASWSILRKNCFIDIPHSNSRGFSQIPALQLEIKDTLQAISRLQRDVGRNDSNNAVTVTRVENGSLTEQNKKDVTIQSSEDFSEINSTRGKSKLDLEQNFSVASSQTFYLKVDSVEKAVDCMDTTFSVLLLKRQIRELLQNNTNPTAAHPVVKKSLKIIDVATSGGLPAKTGQVSTKGSTDPLKVKFVSLRKMSDHTVLVKWKVPQDVNSVEGYELLVDGRSVQKIISPSRCMAVVTCLPHVDKVLITIRTLVSSAVQCAHCPASTVVYRMRAK